MVWLVVTTKNAEHAKGVLKRPGFWCMCCGRYSVVPRKRGTLAAMGCSAHRAMLRPRRLESRL